MTDPKELAKLYTPKEVKSLKTDQQQCAVRFTPCGRFLIGAGFDGQVRRWDATNDGFKELVLKNTGLVAIGTDIAFLAVFTVVAMAAATALFKRTL